MTNISLFRHLLFLYAQWLLKNELVGKLLASGQFFLVYQLFHHFIEKTLCLAARSTSNRCFNAPRIVVGPFAFLILRRADSGKAFRCFDPFSLLFEVSYQGLRVGMLLGLRPWLKEALLLADGLAEDVELEDDVAVCRLDDGGIFAL